MKIKPLCKTGAIFFLSFQIVSSTMAKETPPSSPNTSEKMLNKFRSGFENLENKNGPKQGVLKKQKNEKEESFFAPAWFPADILEVFKKELIDTKGKNARVPGFDEKKIDDQKHKSCVQKYQDFYNKNIMSFRVYFGYANSKAKNYVYDRYRKSIFVDHITKPCPDGYFLCGFSKIFDEGDMFSKDFILPDGKKQKVLLTVKDSSVSDNKEHNRTILKKEQNLKTDEVTTSYLESIKRDDVVMYVGHARWGTGPGFKPMPKYTPQWLWAGIYKPVLKGVTSTLKDSKNKPILGFLVCDGEKYYHDKISEAAPNAAIISTRQKTKSLDNMRTLAASLNSLLGMHCEDSFKEGMEKSTLRFIEETRRGRSNEELLPTIFNFF